MCIISAALHCIMLYIFMHMPSILKLLISMLELIHHACRFYPGQLHCMLHGHKLTSLMHMLSLGNYIIIISFNTNASHAYRLYNPMS